MVNTLHITAPGVDIIVSRAEATSTYVAPPPPNDDPVAVNDSATTPQDTAVLIDVAFNDEHRLERAVFNRRLLRSFQPALTLGHSGQFRDLVSPSR